MVLSRLCRRCAGAAALLGAASFLRTKDTTSTLLDAPDRENGWLVTENACSTF